MNKFRKIILSIIVIVGFVFIVDNQNVQAESNLEIKVKKSVSVKLTEDIKAVRLWKSYSDETKEMWLHNAFCINCGNASFRPGYNLRKDKFGLVIEGFCEKCEGWIVRCCD